MAWATTAAKGIVSLGIIDGVTLERTCKRTSKVFKALLYVHIQPNVKKVIMI